MRTDFEIREKIASTLDARLKLKERLQTEFDETQALSKERVELLVQQATLGGVIASLYCEIGHDSDEIKGLAGNRAFFD